MLTLLILVVAALVVENLEEMEVQVTKNQNIQKNYHQKLVKKTDINIKKHIHVNIITIYQVQIK